MEGRTGEPVNAGDTRIWAGRIGDPFYIDLSLLSMVNGPVRNGSALELSGWQPDRAENSFADTTVESIVLEVSHQHPRLRPGTRIGVWSASKLATDAGGWRQINRFGHPMMWPIFWPDDTKFTNPANTRHPSEDFEADGKYIGDQIAPTMHPKRCCPRRRHRRAIRAEAVGGQASARQQLPIRRASMTAPDRISTCSRW